MYPVSKKKKKKEETHLSHVTTNLPNLRKKQQPRHPLMGAESRLARKIMQVRDQSLEHVFHPLILAQGVDLVYVFGDVVGR